MSVHRLKDTINSSRNNDLTTPSGLGGADLSAVGVSRSAASPVPPVPRQKTPSPVPSLSVGGKHYREEVEELKGRLSKMLTLSEQDKKLIHSLQKKIDDQRKELEGVNAKLITTQQTYSELATHLKVERAQRDGSGVALEEAKQTISELHDKLAERDNIEKERDELKTLNGDMAARLERVRHDFDTLRIQRKRIATRLKQTTDKCLELEEELVAMRTERNSLKLDARTSKNQEVLTKTKLEEIDVVLQTTLSEKKELVTEIRSLKKDLSLQEGENSALTEAMERIKQTNRENTEYIERLTSENTELRESLSNETDQRMKFEKLLVEKEEDYRRQLDNTEESLQTLKFSSAGETESLRVELEETKARNAELEEKLSVLQDEHTQLADNLTIVRKESEMTARALEDRLISANVEKENEMKRLEARLAASQEEKINKYREEVARVQESRRKDREMMSDIVTFSSRLRDWRGSLFKVSEELVGTVAKMQHANEAMESSVTCMSCMDTFENPTAMFPCGHVACRNCIPSKCKECGMAVDGRATLAAVEELISKFTYQKQAMEALRRVAEESAAAARDAKDLVLPSVDLATMDRESLSRRGSLRNINDLGSSRRTSGISSEGNELQRNSHESRRQSNASRETTDTGYGSEET